MLHQDDGLEALKFYEENYFDSLLTDPPAGISFMGKEWDGNKGGRDSWIEWMEKIMLECKRVMKPGAHGLVWALPRTSHWTATALENAGFEIRDIITHLFGTGFPKSHNLQEGRGTALKPANEHWILIRKPISEKTVAKNVEKWGCGGINIDASRIEIQDLNNFSRNWDRKKQTDLRGGCYSAGKPSGMLNTVTAPGGRFPANLVLSHTPECEDDICSIFCPVRLLDEQSGNRPSRGEYKKGKGNYIAAANNTFGYGGTGKDPVNKYANEMGGASRFFYCAKASKKDRGDENKHPCVKNSKLMEYLTILITPSKGKVLDPFMGSGSTGVACSKLGFQFHGIEKDPDYFKIAEKRIKAIKMMEV